MPTVISPSWPQGYRHDGFTECLQTLGHKPSHSNGLGMTAQYTHTRSETQREQIERALRLWPESLQHALERVPSSPS
jgi:hypothetical protein